MRTLKPSAFHGTVHCSPNFLSNGHWAIRKSCVRNAGLYETAGAVEAQGLIFREQKLEVEAQCYDDAATKAAGRTWTVTPLLWRDGKTTVRLLLAVDNGDLAGIDDAYLALLTDAYDGQTLEGRDATSPFLIRDADGAVDVVLMPRVLTFPYAITRTPDA